MQVEAHRREVAEHPGGRSGEAGYGSGIHEPALAALDAGDLAYFRLVRVPAADQVPLAGARHGVAVVVIVHDEDPPAGEFDARVDAVVAGQSTPRPREGIGAVMAVRDDADFHAPILARKQRGAIPLMAVLFAERWYFFAEARHPQNLYYQTIS